MVSHVSKQVKAEHQLPSGLLQPVKIPLWKWEHTYYSLQKLAKRYGAEIIRHHRVPISIILDLDLRITSQFWKKLHDAQGTRLDFSTTFYLQTDGKPNRMAPYEALYGWKCCTLLCWIELGERKILGPALVAETEDKVSPWKKVLRFGHKGKLSPRFIRPYWILRCVDRVAYQLELPLELDRIHDVFYLSMLRRYQSDPSHVVLMEEIELMLDLSFKEESIQILDGEVKVADKNEPTGSVIRL
ncbi:uncharacterized protein LOC105801173 [Gossypium raimondii]|uniref:uncharacterized protein LOC105801173 n=1 Tax=Gossypium raimondii TaxID=29730 RepID=UPI00227D538A|nr:uncharacterized protein LOC105801173 [Gossypium raimondii]